MSSQKLVFKNCRKINYQNYKELAPVYIEQMAISATLGFGKQYTTAEDFLDQCSEGDDSVMIELWDVVSENEPEKVLYDCWVYIVDTANVFYAGTANDTGIGMCQWYFEGSLEDDEKETNLVDALQKAFDNK